METSVILTGLLIMFARILDVSMGTIRTIVLVQGRILLAFVLGFFEVIIWVSVVSAVISQVHESPILAVFFALGFALGNVLGILVEQKIALGPILLKLITPENRRDKIVNAFKELSLDATTFAGTGTQGPVTEIYTVCRRKDLKTIIPLLRKIDPEVFYFTEQVRDVSKMRKPLNTPMTGWRSVAKRK